MSLCCSSRTTTPRLLASQSLAPKWREGFLRQNFSSMMHVWMYGSNMYYCCDQSSSFPLSSIMRWFDVLEISGEQFFRCRILLKPVEASNGDTLASAWSISQSLVQVCCWFWKSFCAGVVIAASNSCVNQLGSITTGTRRFKWGQFRPNNHIKRWY